MGSLVAGTGLTVDHIPYTILFEQRPAIPMLAGLQAGLESCPIEAPAERERKGQTNQP